MEVKLAALSGNYNIQTEKPTDGRTDGQAGSLPINYINTLIIITIIKNNLGNATTNSSNVCYNPDPDLVPRKRCLNGTESAHTKPIEDAVVMGLYDGLLNVTTCKFNAPSYVSFPHFYLADPAVMEPFHEDSGMGPRISTPLNYYN